VTGVVLSKRCSYPAAWYIFSPALYNVRTAIELDSRRKGADEILNVLANDPEKLSSLATLLAKLGLVGKIKEL